MSLPSDGDFGTLDKRIKGCKTVKRGNCRDCGNPWWHDLPQSYVCTTCAKTHGKSRAQELLWSPKGGDPICPTCYKPIKDKDLVMHHNCLPEAPWPGKKE